MTRFQALYVKYCRVRLECTYRTVHKMWQRRYVPKEEWWHNEANDRFRSDLIKSFDGNSNQDKLIEILSAQPDGNQIVGRKLCNEAELLLGESFEEEDVIF